MKVEGVFAMRRYLIAAAALAIATAAANVPSQAQPYYGSGMMGGYGGGYGMGPGMMYGYGDGYGPGMRYDYDRDGRPYYGRRGEAYRGKRRCWHQTGPDRDQGYYGSCRD
jgi:hypothetical protein